MRAYTSFWIFFMATCLSVTSTPVSEFPSFLKICHRNDPYLNDCIKQSVNLLKPHLKNGIQALNVPPCEPLYLDEIDINQYSGLIYIHAKYRNVAIFGGSNFILRNIRYDVLRNRMQLKLYIPRLQMIADYKLDGKIMMLPIKGNGLARGNFSDTEAIVTLQMERYRNEVTGQIHQRIDNVHVDFDIGHANIHLNNMFDGDEMLSNGMNLFLNENWRTVIAELKPKLEETIAVLIKRFTNKIFSVIPEHALLPP